MKSVNPVEVLLVGDGAETLKIAKWIASSKLVSAVYCVPNNPEINRIAGAEGVDIQANDVTALLSFALLHEVNVAVFGSENLFTSSIDDAFKRAKLKIIKPSEAMILSEEGKFPASRFM